MREKLMEARTEVEHANDAAHYEIKKRQSKLPRPPAEIPGREIRGRAEKTARNFLKKESGQKTELLLSVGLQMRFGRQTQRKLKKDSSNC